MGIAGSTYYHARPADRDAEILTLIEAICAEFEAYGYRRVTAELPGESQHAHLGADDLWPWSWSVSSRTPRRGAAHPDHSAPGLGSYLSQMTPLVRLSPNYFSTTTCASPREQVRPDTGFAASSTLQSCTAQTDVETHHAIGAKQSSGIGGPARHVARRTPGSAARPASHSQPIGETNHGRFRRPGAPTSSYAPTSTGELFSYIDLEARVRGLGLDEELPAEGRVGRAASVRRRAQCGGELPGRDGARTRPMPRPPTRTRGSIARGPARRRSCASWVMR